MRVLQGHNIMPIAYDLATSDAVCSRPHPLHLYFRCTVDRATWISSYIFHLM